MVGRYSPSGRYQYPDYQQVVQAYRALRAQYEQLVLHEQQQAQRIAQLEQANRQQPAQLPVKLDPVQTQANSEQLARLEAQLTQARSEILSLSAALESAEQQAVTVEKEHRAALEMARQDGQKLAIAQEKIQQLQKDLDAAGDAAEWRDRFLRQQADNENYRRRQERRFAQQAAEDRRSLLRDVLPLVDNLDLGLQHLLKDAGAAADQRLQGYAGNLRAVRQAFLDTLERHGVHPVAALGEPFDPNVHEALGQIASDDVPEGYVAQVVQSGFSDPDGLVRPARVLVSSGAAGGSAASDAER